MPNAESQSNSSLFHDFFRASPQAMWIFDPADDSFVEVNDAACGEFGYSREEFLALTVRDLRPTEDQDSFDRGFADGHWVEPNAPRVWRHCTKDGRILYMDVLSAEIQAGGRALVASVLRDVTQEHTLESASQVRNENLSKVLDSARCVLWQADVRGGPEGLIWELEVQNPLQAQSFLPLDVSGDRSYSQSFLDAKLPEDEHGLWQLPEAAAMPSERDAYHQEYRVRTVDGQIRWIKEDATIDPIGHRHWRFTGVCTDITDKRAAEAALQSANEELEQKVQERTVEFEAAKVEAEKANRAKSEFLSRMSHELRTPLNAILGFGQLLGYSELTSRQREEVEHIVKGGNHLLKLINEVLDVSRIEAGRLDLSLEPVDVERLLGETCAMLEPLAREARISLMLQKFGEKGLSASADIQRLKQVFINLISNAIKYNSPGGSVRVSWSVTEGRVQIIVTDTGWGMAESDLSLLFTPFQRLGNAQRPTEGTGLGLALSKRLVEAMGGQIGVTSTLGKGSRFVVTLMRAEAPAIVAGDYRSSLPDVAVGTGVDSPRYRILVIEDNLSNLKLLQTVMQFRTDIALEFAMQGGIGLELARSSPFDLILLDLNLPDMHGSAVISALRKTESTPIFIVSADATPGQIERLMSLGANDYLTKPIDVRLLLDKVESVLPRSRQRDAV